MCGALDVALLNDRLRERGVIAGRAVGVRTLEELLAAPLESVTDAARAIGVAQNALELGLTYALDRKQFGQAIFAFPRVHNKLAMMAAEIMGVRQLTYFAAARKDDGKRCDLEAGMAKLVASEAGGRVVDRSMQIHGGYGMTKDLPFERWYREMRIRRVGEGPNEVQRHVIARDLLGAGLR